MSVIFCNSHPYVNLCTVISPQYFSDDISFDIFTIFCNSGPYVTTFCPISANLILHLIVCDLRPPDQKRPFFFLLFLVCPVFQFLLQFQLWFVHPQSQTQIIFPLCETTKVPKSWTPFPTCTPVTHHCCDLVRSFVFTKVAVSARRKQKSGVYKCSAFLRESSEGERKKHR